MPRQLHDYVHFLLKNFHPHQALLFVLRICWKPLKEEIKQQIREILDVAEPEHLYKEWTIKNVEKFKKQLNKII